MHILYLVSVVLVCCCRHWHFTHPIFLPLHPWFKSQNFFFFFRFHESAENLTKLRRTLQDQSLKTSGSGFSSHRRLSFTMEAVFQARLKFSSSAFWNMPFVDDICGISAPFSPKGISLCESKRHSWEMSWHEQSCWLLKITLQPFAEWRRITSHYFCFWSLLNMLLTALVKRLMCC